MPTEYTNSVEKIMRVDWLRKNAIQKTPTDIEICWGQIPILVYIEKHENCTLSEIASALKLTPAAVTKAVKRMENNNFVVKTVNSENMRSKSLKISEKGKTALRLGTEVFDFVDGLMFDNFSEDEINVFNGLVDKIIDNLLKQEKLKEFRSKCLPWKFKEDE